MFISALGLAALGFVVWKIPPGTIWIELITLLLLTITITLVMVWLIGNTKRGVLVTLAIIGIFIMRRLGILDWLTGVLWLAVLGLITLIK